MHADTIPCEPLARRLVEHVEMRSRVLVIGCGTGGLARLVARRGATVTAVDASPEAIAEARSLTGSHLGIEYRVVELERLAPRGFDMVIIHELPAAMVLARLADALRPGACLAVIGHHRAWWSRASELQPLTEISRVARTLLSGCRIERHLGARYSVRWQKPR